MRGTWAETRAETRHESQLLTVAENAEAAAHSHVVESIGLQSCQKSHSSNVCLVSCEDWTCIRKVISQNHRITESQNGRGWKGPLWVI